MATLKEMIAAKKAAAEAAVLAATGLAPVKEENKDIVIDVGPSPTDSLIQGKTEQEALDRVRDASIRDSMESKPNLLAAMGLEPASTPVPVTIDPSAEMEAKATAPVKPMTFAEKMALKKAAVEGKKNEEQNGQLSIQAPKEEQKPAEAIKLTKEQEENLAEIEDAEMAQAYSDIALKINFLSTTESGEPLGNAMANLKKALHKNPSASMMLLDTDIGQMTIALRRYTHVEMAVQTEDKEAKKAGKKAGKAVNVVLTPEMLALQFSDL